MQLASCVIAAIWLWIIEYELVIHNTIVPSVQTILCSDVDLYKSSMAENGTACKTLHNSHFSFRICPELSASPSVQSLISKCFLVGVKVVCGFLWGSLEPFHANQWGPALEELHAWLLWTRLGKWANRLHGSRFSRFSWPLKYGGYSPYLNASQVIFDRSHWPLNRFLIRSHSVGCQCYKSDLCRLS